MEYLLFLIPAVPLWYGLGVLGSNVGFAGVYGDASLGWRYTKLFGLGVALGGPLNLIVTVVMFGLRRREDA